MTGFIAVKYQLEAGFFIPPQTTKVLPWLTLSPLIFIQLYYNIEDVCSDCKRVKELIILKQRIFTNVWKQVYLDIERMNLPLLRSNRFPLKVVGFNDFSTGIRNMSLYLQKHNLM